MTSGSNILIWKMMSSTRHGLFEEAFCNHNISHTQFLDTAFKTSFHVPIFLLLQRVFNVYSVLFFKNSK
ncbi:unnamed protein product [Caenorhabditis brenneri]